MICSKDFYKYMNKMIKGKLGILYRVIRNKYILNNHLNIFKKLGKYRDRARKENEILELHFNKLNFNYGTMCMAEGVDGGDEIIFCTDYYDDTEYEAITILLKDNKTYKIKKCSVKGYSLKLIEK